ncbi:hypothetical protein SAMN05216255_2676 [Pseudomonas segetis]|uniref:Uncharacterized protein n=1 Tax=Pseudomonas segetis TaxID=298908 RepID=A0A239FM53_9PSED|nr:hypothetical protein SAMN05216255_2676 [Pseudomonas segetis]
MPCQQASLLEFHVEPLYSQGLNVFDLSWLVAAGRLFMGRTDKGFG